MAINKKFKRFNGTSWEEYHFYAYDAAKLGGESPTHYATKTDNLITSTSNRYTRSIDPNEVIVFNNSSNQYFYIDQDNTASHLSVGDKITIIRKGSGGVALVPIGSVNLYRNIAGNPGEGVCWVSGQYRGITIQKTGTDEWIALGAIST